MDENVEVICAPNPSWRVLRIAGRAGWGPPCWHVENVDDPRQGAVFRMKSTLIEYVTYKCGTITPEALTVIRGLPDRCDRDPARQPALKPRPEKRPVHRNCRRCGIGFVVANNGIRFFCSTSCRSAHHEKRRPPRRQDRKAASALPAATVPKSPPTPISERSPRKRPTAERPERPLTPEQQLAEQMKLDRIELMAAAAAADLPERISAAARKQTGKGWALQR
jgi:hypothetical protein